VIHQIFGFVNPPSCLIGAWVWTSVPPWGRRVREGRGAHLILEVFWRAQVPWDRKINPSGDGRAAVGKVYHDLRKTSPEAARLLVRKVLEQNGGNVSKTARILGISRKTVRRAREGPLDSSLNAFSPFSQHEPFIFRHSGAVCRTKGPKYSVMPL